MTKKERVFAERQRKFHVLIDNGWAWPAPMRTMPDRYDLNGIAFARFLDGRLVLV